MKEKAPTLSELRYDRMEVRAKYGRSIAERAKACGGLTQLEACELTLLNIEQDMDRLEWANLLRSEGHYVDLLDYPDRSLQTGIRVNAYASGRPRVDVYGDIGRQFGGLIADDLRLALLEIPDHADMDLRVHSDGGDFSEGCAMHALIASRSGKTFGFVHGRACSAATFPLMACTTVTMATGARLMIHQASASMKDGQADDFVSAAKTLEETNQAIVAIYEPRWRGSRASLIAAVAAETWFTAEQAIAAGLADSISHEVAIAAHISRRHQYKNIPAPLTIAARKQDCPMLMAAELDFHRCAIVH